MTMQRRFFSGDSLTQAVNQAAQHFQVPASEIEYKLIEKRHGFLKVRRKVLIEVDEAKPCREPERAESARAATTGDSAGPKASDTWSEVVRAPSGGEGPSADAVEARSLPDPRATSWFDHEPSDDTANEEGGEDWREADPSPGSTGAPESAEAGWKSESAEPERELESAATEPYATEARPAEPEAVTESEAETRNDAGVDGESSAKPGRGRRSRRGRGRRGRPDSSRRVELAEAPPPAKARYTEAQGEEAEAAADALDRILKLAGLVVESEILQADEHLQIELRGADQDLLLRDRGRLLLAIQHLLPRAIRGLIGRSVACRVDSDNYHDIREERLRDMAQRAADEVRDGGRPKTLEPMSPDERRIVHLTLADYPGVETESHGSGLFKRVMVRTTSGGRGQRSESYRR